MDLSLMEQVRQLRQRNDEEAERERLEKLTIEAKGEHLGKRVRKIELSGYSDDCHGLRISCEDGEVIDIVNLFGHEYTPVELAIRDTPSTVLHHFALGWATEVAFPVPAEIKDIIPGKDKHVIQIGNAG